MYGRSRFPLYLTALCAVLYLPGLGARDFWSPVEPRYAEIARVMFLNNEWIVPSVNGNLYTDKPIFYFWLVLLFSKLAGAVNEWTVRLPAALGGLGAVLATYKLGKDFFSAKIGLIGAVVFATSLRVVWESRWAHLDMLFTFFFTLAILFAARFFLKGTSRGELVLFYALLALATLTKGLIGVVLPGLILGAYVITTRDWRLIGAARLPLGAAVFLLVAAPWFLLVSDATGGTWIRDFVFVHHIRRYTDGSGHREPFFYYFRTLPVDLLPWTVFALPALLAYPPRRRLWTEPVPWFFALWFVAVFLFFSVSDTKRDLYLLPLMPCAALFIARYLDDLGNGRLAETRLQRAINLFFFGSLLIACLALPAVTWFLRRDAFWLSLPVAATLGASAAVTVWLALRPVTWRFLWSIAAIMVVTVITASAWILPYIDFYKSPRPFSLAVNRIVPPGAPLYIYRDTMNDFNFYTDRAVIPVLSTPEAVNEAFNSQPGFLLIERRRLERMKPPFRGAVVLERAVGGDVWCLMSFGAPAAGPAPADRERHARLRG